MWETGAGLTLVVMEIFGSGLGLVVLLLGYWVWQISSAADKAIRELEFRVSDLETKLGGDVDVDDDDDDDDEASTSWQRSADG